jgi:hypothetical protein
MSYCRFSSCDYWSDIYCYESANGYEVHVATNRHVFDEPLPPTVDLTTDSIEAYLVRHNKMQELLDRAKCVTIGLPYDGQTLTHDTAKECAETLIYLKEMGYHVPQSAIGFLVEESEENGECQDDEE